MRMWTVGTLCREKLSPPASTTRSLGTSVVSTLHDAYNPGGIHYQCPQETPVPDKAAQTNSKLKLCKLKCWLEILPALCALQDLQRSSEIVELYFCFLQNCGHQGTSMSSSSSSSYHHLPQFSSLFRRLKIFTE